MRFNDAIKGKQQLSIIAEVKLKSPSHGEFKGVTLEDQIKKYLAAGIDAVSLVTDPVRFNGSVELIRQTRELTDLPIIRKDFIRDEKVLDETKAYGADAALLIVKDLTKEELEKLVAHCIAIGIDPVAEVYSPADTEKIKDLPLETIILINNRNLDTLEINAAHGLEILPLINPDHTIIAASGFATKAAVIPYRWRVDAILVGTSLLTATDPSTIIHDLTTF
ncbi:indole-3-glycerol-phosphate synthase [Candidatus Gracilibacteria bacterium]|nr:indole-3-glycerol-phosphate synthase [Candidatus Gracilibacteria bacterium]